MAALEKKMMESLKMIKEMAINKMNEVIRMAESKLESREGLLEESKEELPAAEPAEVAEETVAETKAKKSIFEPKGTGPRRGEMSSIIRDIFRKNPEAKNSEVIAHMKKAHNIEVKPSLVSTVKIEMGKKTRRAEKKETKAKGRRGRKSKGGLPLPACVTRVLSKSKSKQGFKAQNVMEGVKKLGYVYSGDKGDAGFLNCVYQALVGLRKDKARSGLKGSGPVLLHDKETHTWKLNPRAERKTA